MDQAIIDIFQKTMGQDLLSAVISNSSDKQRMTKVKLRPVLIKDELLIQASEFIGEKVFHTNYQMDGLIAKLPDWFDHLFKQAELITKSGTVIILVSKKGKATINFKKTKAQPGFATDSKDSLDQEAKHSLSHNKTKNYILKEGIPLPFLIDLGVMTKEGQVVKAKSDKFKQINRYLEFIEDVLPYLDQDRELTILDFGCGKSYLTFALYYYLTILKGYQIQVIGLDLKSEVIQECNRLSEKYKYHKLRFLVGDITSYQGNNQVDMVVTLHACDTATDYALYKAVNWGAKVILSVPCCQHELNKQMHNEMLTPIFQYGIIKERMAALLTDALRAELLVSKGYKVQLLEFIDIEHTPKNILIRAVKRSDAVGQNMKHEQELKACMEMFHVSPCLQQLFQEEIIEEGK